MALPVFRLGFAAPLTGPQAIVGAPMRQCAALAIDQANQRGDLPFYAELRAEDDEATPTGARAVAERFINDPAVLGVIGHKNSGPSAAAGPLYAAASLLQVTPSSTNTALSQQGYPTFFRICAHDAIQGRVAAQYAIHVLGTRRVAILNDQTDYGLPLAQVATATVEAEGGQVVLFEAIQEGAQDFSPTVERLSVLQPDLVYFGLTEIEASIIARQLRQAGVTSLLFGTDGSPESQFLPLAGTAAEGVYQTYAGVDVASTPAAQPFVNAYRALYGEPPVYGAEVYDAANLLLIAIAQVMAGVGNEPVNRAAVLGEVKALRGFEGASGRIQFDACGDRVDPTITLWRVEDGQMRLLGTAHELLPSYA